MELLTEKMVRKEKKEQLGLPVLKVQRVILEKLARRDYRAQKEQMEKLR